MHDPFVDLVVHLHCCGWQEQLLRPRGIELIDTFTSSNSGQQTGRALFDHFDPSSIQPLLSSLSWCLERRPTAPWGVEGEDVQQHFSFREFGAPGTQRILQRETTKGEKNWIWEKMGLNKEWQERLLLFFLSIPVLKDTFFAQDGVHFPGSVSMGFAQQLLRALCQWAHQQCKSLWNFQVNELCQDV